eukprot:3137949-Pyramimonas_sp.AAC.1
MGGDQLRGTNGRTHPAHPLHHGLERRVQPGALLGLAVRALVAAVPGPGRPRRCCCGPAGVGSDPP